MILQESRAAALRPLNSDPSRLVSCGGCPSRDRTKLSSCSLFFPLHFAELQLSARRQPPSEPYCNARPWSPETSVWEWSHQPFPRQVMFCHRPPPRTHRIIVGRRRGRSHARNSAVKCRAGKPPPSLRSGAYGELCTGTMGYYGLRATIGYHRLP